MRDASEMQVRAHVERQIGLVAQGKAEKGAVVTHTLLQFAAKFAFFVRNISRMDALFEASFSPLASSGVAGLGTAAQIDNYARHAGPDKC